MKTVSIQLPDPMDDYIQKVATGRLTSKASIVREILLAHVKANCPEVIAELEIGQEKNEVPA